MTGTKKKLLKQSKTYIGLRVRKGGAMSDDNWRKEFDKEFVKEYPYGNSLDIKDRSKFEPVWNGNKPSPSTIKQFIKDLLARQSEEWQGETLDERCDWHKDVEGGFHCQYCCPICNPELKNTGGKE